MEDCVVCNEPCGALTKCEDCGDTFCFEHGQKAMGGGNRMICHPCVEVDAWIVEETRLANGAKKGSGGAQQVATAA